MSKAESISKAKKWAKDGNANAIANGNEDVNEHWTSLNMLRVHLIVLNVQSFYRFIGSTPTTLPYLYIHLAIFHDDYYFFYCFLHLYAV